MTETAGGSRAPDVVAMPREYLRAPLVPPLRMAQKLRLLAAGLTLGPAALAWAAWRRLPGLGWHAEAYRLALRVVAQDPRALATPLVQRLLLFPMDSTRYFEFDCVGRWLVPLPCAQYLDVSSPRLFPLSLLARPGVTAHLSNPSPPDLADTRFLVERAGLPGRCHFHAETVDALPLAHGSMDVITSLSVVEHIPDDAGAVRAMWRMLRPGGRLFLSVPCARARSEQYVERNYYGVLPSGEGGGDAFYFWQRFYDEALLAERFFATTGPPARRAVYGERVPGTLQANLARKRVDVVYPLWAEPLLMTGAFREYASIADLPGEGVIALEFVKGALEAR